MIEQLSEEYRNAMAWFADAESFPRTAPQPRTLAVIQADMRRLGYEWDYRRSEPRRVTGAELTPADLERGVQREFLHCPECEQWVHTKPAEGVPAQALRACDECDAVFFMDLDAKPIYEKPEN